MLLLVRQFSIIVRRYFYLRRHCHGAVGEDGRGRRRPGGSRSCCRGVMS